MQSEEVLDLVSEDDRVIGTLPREEVYKLNKNNFRVINAFIRNSKGQLWIPVRHRSKKLFPDALDASVGGHVESGESYHDAFLRETKEEINIDLDAGEHSFEFLGKLNPSNNGTSAFMHVYVIYSDDVPLYNEGDFSSWSWRFPDEIIKMDGVGVAMKSDLPVMIKELFSENI